MKELDIIKPNDNFTQAHIVYVLQIIQEEIVIGRYEIEKLLELNNTEIRTLLRRLSSLELITPIKRKGHMLTEKGQNIVKQLKQKIPYQGFLNLEGLIPFPSYTIQVRKPAQSSKNGITERDLAVRNGADGGITIHYSNQTFHIPGINSELLENYPKVVERIGQTIDFQIGDNAFTAFAKTKAIASFAAITVGLWMITQNT